MSERKEEKLVGVMGVAMLSLLALFMLCVNYSYGQSYTETTYKNNISGVTTTTFVADRVSNNASSYVIQSSPNVGINNLAYETAVISTTFQVEQELERLKPIRAEFVGIQVTELDSLDGYTESWSNNNHCTYKSDPIKREISFVEWNPSGERVKSWTHEVVETWKDETVTGFKCHNGMIVLIWNDKTMVSLETGKETYLVTGVLHSAQ